jgi:Kdo2-lipid IVA lauroyltransferase/acyltransferase
MKPVHIFEYAVFQTVAFLVQLMPISGAQWIGRTLGRFVFWPLGYRKEVTLSNLRRAFPEKSESEIVAIARGAYENIGISLLEFVWFPKMSREQLGKMVHFDKPDVVQGAYDKGKGLIILTAHFGNWELMGQSFIVRFGFLVNGLAKTQSNPFVNRSINKRRSRVGNRVIQMETSLREVLRALRNGEAVGLVADQAAPKENVPIEFFGTMVPTHQGPSALCLKLGSPMVSVFSVRRSDGLYDAIVQEVPSQDLKGDSEENINELTRRHVKILEDIIRKYPDQWLWQHKRWKHVPLEPGVDGSTMR